MTAKLVTYLPRTMPTLGGDQLYLQQELAAISNAITALNSATKADEASWIPYTPSVTTTSGAFGSYSASGRYLQIGKTVQLAVNVSITANGAGGGAVFVSLPVAASGLPAILAGRENAVMGYMLQGLISPGATTMTVFNYANSYPGGSGYQLLLSGSYEAA